jgi:hypothetical protein
MSSINQDSDKNQGQPGKSPNQSGGDKSNTKRKEI